MLADTHKWDYITYTKVLYHDQCIMKMYITIYMIYFHVYMIFACKLITNAFMPWYIKLWVLINEHKFDHTQWILSVTLQARSGGY